MSPLWSGIVFATVALALLFAAHRYLWARLVRDPRLPTAWRRALTGLIALLGLLVPVAFALGWSLPRERTEAVSLLAWTWMGLVFYGVLLLALLDLLELFWERGAAQRGARSSATDEELLEARLDRRAFLARTGAGVAVLGTGGLGVVGTRSARGEIATPELEIPLWRLPRALEGYRIVQLTDLHLGPLLGAGWLEAVVEQTNALRPDLIVITGDLVDGSVAALGKEIAPLAKLRSRHGTVFTTGNHEYYSGAAEWCAFLEARGIEVLLNRRIAVGDAGPGGASFDLAGIPDTDGARFAAGHAPDLAAALEGRDDRRELLLLAHRPSQVRMAARHDVGLMLSGHTHGGQLWPFGWAVRLVEPYVQGLHVHERGVGERGVQVYVSRGTGFWGPPMRVGNPAEITSLVLTSA